MWFKAYPAISPEYLAGMQAAAGCLVACVLITAAWAVVLSNPSSTLGPMGPLAGTPMCSRRFATSVRPMLAALGWTTRPGSGPTHGPPNWKAGGPTQPHRKVYGSAIPRFRALGRSQLDRGTGDYPGCDGGFGIAGKSTAMNIHRLLDSATSGRYLLSAPRFRNLLLRRIGRGTPAQPPSWASRSFSSSTCLPNMSAMDT